MDHLQKIIKGLTNPMAYPHIPGEVIFIQTAISAVFIAGDLVYKVKKPVDFGYLDFTTLEKRKFYSEEEVRLNRRLCPDIYLGVVPVTDDAGRITVGGTGEIIDYTVKMKRLPQAGMMDEMLERGEVTEGHITKIARALVPFYRDARTGSGIDVFGTIESFSVNTDENFNQTAQFIGETITERQFDEIKEYTRNFYVDNADLFEERIRGGFIREGHGDLHSRNICIIDATAVKSLSGVHSRNEVHAKGESVVSGNGINVYVYDCIEFNERFRIGDVAEDIAFLAMDIDFHLYPALSRHFVDEYVRLSGDKRMRDILNFYKCYTAYVRGKVMSLILTEPEESYVEKEEAKSDARSYFSLAYHYAVMRKKPFLLITMGLSGTGKSTVADGLSFEMDFEVISSDVVRKELVGIDPYERRREGFGDGIYSEEMTEKTYSEIFRRARELLQGGRSIILDGAFLQKGKRDRAKDLAKECGARFYEIETICPENVAKERLAERMTKRGVSDATSEVYQKQKELFAVERAPISDHRRNESRGMEGIREIDRVRIIPGDSMERVITVDTTILSDDEIRSVIRQLLFSDS